MSMRSISRYLFFTLLLLTISGASFAQVSIGISVGFPPPAIPIYEQPICPHEGYLWTPGYWAWDDDDGDYYWVPGTWILAPEVGFLWTPPWWGWEGGIFLFHEGWWGPHVGFYGGINYGFGYFGEGFVGGRWDHDHFFYNREVMNVNVVNIHNVYNEHVDIRNSSHVSFNGGEGGINARPRREDEQAARDRHIGPVAAQNEHFQTARSNRELHASANQGRPPIAATGRAGDFRGSVVAAREAGAPYHAPANRGGGQPRTEGSGSRGGNAAPRSYNHANELPPIERPAAPNTGDPNRDRKYQQQQQKLMDKQNQERQKLQQQQEKEHAQLARQNANDTRKQQVEQRHQQQTQQMQQRHESQRQSLQSRQAPPPRQKH
jgi:hypothetical protein